jgi:hypothetical protein
MAPRPTKLKQFMFALKHHRISEYLPVLAMREIDTQELGRAIGPTPHACGKVL